MSEIFVRFMEDNSKITAGVTIGLYGFILKYLVFDPYKQCNAFLTAASVVFTVGITIALPLWVTLTDFKDFMDWGVAWLLKLATASGSAMTVYALWKKTNSESRKKASRIRAAKKRESK